MDLKEEIKLSPVLTSKIPHKCPICGGSTKVPRGFYDQTSGQWSTTDATPEPCRACVNGIVWG